MVGMSTMNAPAGTIPGKAAMEEVDTRFGKVLINKSQPLNFPKGPLGMPDMRRFVLTEFPVRKFAQFRLLQSLDDYALSFITLPQDASNAIVQPSDVNAACVELGISPANLLLLFIVSVHRFPGYVQLSVNARAPIFIDTARMTAEQHVFHNDAYQLQHMLTGFGDTARVQKG